MAILNIAKFRENSLETNKYGSPPFNWIPPEWTGDDPPVLEDTAAKGPDFPRLQLKCDRLGENSPGEDKPDPDDGKLKKFPHPCSDFSHIDPDDFTEEDFATAKKKLGEGSPEFKKLKRFVGPDSLGMQRLALVFEFTLCQVTDLLEDINSTLRGSPDKTKGPDKANYNKAREAYIDFLANLDDREPEITGRPVASGKSGYGKAIKWAYFDPVIVNGAIVGARVIIRWNPHLSSSGVPINH
jgi:hypothetical protein